MPPPADRQPHDRVFPGNEEQQAPAFIQYRTQRIRRAEIHPKHGAQILSYPRSKGLVAGLELKGTVISQDKEHMEGVYGKGVTVREVLKENKVKAPAEVQVFPGTLYTYSARKARE